MMNQAEVATHPIQCTVGIESANEVTRKEKLISYIKSLTSDFEDEKISEVAFSNSLFLISTAWLSFRSGETLHVDVVDWEVTSRISKLLPNISITIEDEYTTFDGKNSPDITLPSSEGVVYVHNEYVPSPPYIKVAVKVCVKDVQVPAAVVIMKKAKETLKQVNERRKVLNEIFKEVIISISVVL